MRRRALSAAFLALVGAMVFMVSGAFADAGNPILGTIKASAVVNNDGTVTIFVRGQWNWLSHGSDCNDDRNGAGVGIVWNDTTEPGFTVTKNGLSAQVGIASLRQGDAVNQIDRSRAVANVLGNALKWSPEGGTVEVSVRRGSVFVRDHGPGIDEADLPLIFERFYRSPAARGTAGSGLGLAIVRHVLDAHGGAAEAVNAPGGGAVFTLRFPLP